MKYQVLRVVRRDFRRSPHGERGLKYGYRNFDLWCKVSLPAWGAWIEIHKNDAAMCWAQSLPAWGAWIEIKESPLANSDNTGRSPHGERGLKFILTAASLNSLESLPAWGAWIEIKKRERKNHEKTVAPRMGSVD